MSAVRIVHGDCLQAMPRLFEDGLRVDAVVTDPPYHLASIVDRLGSPDAAPIQSGATGVYARSSSGFMGQQWDGGDIAFRAETWRAVYALMKPGAHLVAFGGTRTYHRMACAIEDAGFEIRDQIGWLYGTGFPKSHNLDGGWQGWGTALKPAWEPICLARKPMIGSVPENVGIFGTGAINIDGCRVPATSGDEPMTWGRSAALGFRQNSTGMYERRDGMQASAGVSGRWPANVTHDGSDEVVSAFPITASGSGNIKRSSGADCEGNRGSALGAESRPAGAVMVSYGDTGSAARFFYSAKATSADRADSKHPTVKPVALMRWLVRLITPPGGLVLDPFAGSGTTGAAARAEGMSSLLIEREDQYVDDICRRLGLDRAAAESATVECRPIEMGDAGPLFGGVAA